MGEGKDKGESEGKDTGEDGVRSWMRARVRSS